eukprot:scaffold23603_cov54-Phaeocystis_antarctica.AAC.1
MHAASVLSRVLRSDRHLERSHNGADPRGGPRHARRARGAVLPASGGWRGRWATVGHAAVRLWRLRLRRGALARGAHRAGRGGAAARGGAGGRGSGAAADRRGGRGRGGRRGRAGGGTAAGRAASLGEWSVRSPRHTGPTTAG